MQYRSKHLYSNKSKKWFKMLRMPTRYENLNFEDYSYILGNKIFHKPSEEAREAFEAEKMWSML